MTVFTQSNTAIQMNVRPSFMITDILAASVNSGSRNMINNNHLDVVAKNDIRVPPTIMPHEYDSDNEFADDADGSDICSNGTKEDDDIVSRPNTINGMRASSKKQRKARTAFSDHQLHSLEKSFTRQKYLSVQDRMELANKLGISDTQVKTWFQNRRTKWKRQTSVGFELLVEAGNYAAYQRAYRNYPQMDAWQYPGAGGSPSPAELYYRQASIAALQGHTPYGIYPGAAVAAAASMSLPKPAFPMFNSPVAAAAAAANSPLNHYYQNVQRLPQHVLGRRSTSPTEPLSLKRCNSSVPVANDDCATKNVGSSDDEEHIEV